MDKVQNAFKNYKVRSRSWSEREKQEREVGLDDNVWKTRDNIHNDYDDAALFGEDDIALVEVHAAMDGRRGRRDRHREDRGKDRENQDEIKAQASRNKQSAMSKDEAIQLLLDRDSKKDEMMNDILYRFAELESDIKNKEEREMHLKPLKTRMVQLPKFEPPENDRYRSPLDRIRLGAYFKKPFDSVKDFNDSVDYPVRTFLENMSSVCQVCQKDDMGYTEDCFRDVLLSKLGHDIRKSISDSDFKCRKSVQEIYEQLLALYDSSETETEAHAKLLRLRAGPKLCNWAQFIKEARRLLNLSDSASTDKAKSMVVAIKNIVPERVMDKLEDYVDQYEARFDKYPTIDCILDQVSRFRSTIDEYMEQKNKDKKYRVNQVSTDETEKSNQGQTSYDQDKGQNNRNRDSYTNDSSYRNRDGYLHRNADRPDRRGYPPCTFCKRPGHSENTCFAKNPCQKCGIKGHTHLKCPTKCRLCNGRHISAKCETYKNVMVTQAMCEYCFDALNLELFHPMPLCKFKEVLKQLEQKN